MKNLFSKSFSRSGSGKGRQLSVASRPSVIVDMSTMFGGGDESFGNMGDTANVVNPMTAMSKRYQKPAGTSYLGRKARDLKQTKVKKNFQTHEARTSAGEDIPGSNPTFTHGNSENAL
uniref:Uncharacterized protein n=1 Tax=Florenciella parvula TaxID=236787 RepID=A0A7S2BIL8_9STRA|mmetsp:Transcript_17211/g.35964  ORF Transcript_17211/g.35964 Transcript_17211/m.35964 type:complete len:118 (+) Transcript_17211:56-409(+)